MNPAGRNAFYTTWSVTTFSLRITLSEMLGFADSRVDVTNCKRNRGLKALFAGSKTAFPPPVRYRHPQ